MRVAAAIVVFSCIGRAQFKSTVPLVVAPTTVTDSKGHYVDGLTLDDLILYDNNFTKTTGGRSFNFLKKNALEQAIQW